ncbi:DNA repair protein XRCC3 isoform X2 [Leptinotarsa decemlineata]|uniref:DNA repair protein XRCC3 isoform X2 n=1 Tax=Leptinotarsa decemlineata TaxID=7539 RepID=UPI003D307EF3
MEDIKSLVDPRILAKSIDDINYPFSILVNDTSQMEKKTGLTLKKIEEVKMKVASYVLISKFITTDQILPWKRISTGCKAIDSTLTGGIPINGITEIFGCSGVGKTQFCLQLCLQVQLLAIDGKEKGAIYICTEDPFPSKRFHQLSTRFKEKHNVITDFEKNVYINHVADFEQLRRCLYVHAPNLLQTKDIGLIIIDSIAGAFRSENVDVNYTSRGRELCEIACKLNNLSDKYQVAIVCINQVTEDVQQGKTEPCLGLAWSNNVNYRCQISRFNDRPTREFEVIFGPDLPCRKCTFEIREDGLFSLED